MFNVTNLFIELFSFGCHFEEPNWPAIPNRPASAPGGQRTYPPTNNHLKAMNKLNRRTFLTGTAKSAGAALALNMLPPSIARALSINAKVETGTIKDIKHIVILMLENRGFDHYFGTMRGVRGFGDRFPTPLPSGKDVWFQQDATGLEIPPYHMDSTKVKALQSPSTPHSFSDMQAAWGQGRSGYWPQF